MMNDTRPSLRGSRASGGQDGAFEQGKCLTFGSERRGRSAGCLARRAIARAIASHHRTHRLRSAARGDCSHAFKGSPGKCCGIREGVSYCCPGEAYRGYQSGDAKCYDCGEVYRCFVGSNQGQICGAGTPVGGSSGAILFFLALALVFVLIVFLLFLLLRLMRRHSYVVIGTPAPGYHPEVKRATPARAGTPLGSVAVGRL